MPKVFISYRQLDDAQRQRVRAFAERVRECGIDVVLDQFYKDAHPGGPPEGWPKWSSDQAIHTEKVIIIGNEPWFRCFDSREQPGTGLGAACEAGDLRQRIYNLGGVQDIIRVAYFDDIDARSISVPLQRYDRFHIGRDFRHLIAWLGGTLRTSEALIEDKPRGLRFWSTRESIDRGEITVLAIIETLLAVTLLITLTVRFDTVKWLAGPCMLAPLMLLRTEYAVSQGVAWWGQLQQAKHFIFWVERVSVMLAICVAVAFGLVSAKYIESPLIFLLTVPILLGLNVSLSAGGLIPLLFLIRAAATAKALFINPLRCLSALPANWKRIILATDSHLPAEYLPGCIISPEQVIEFAMGPTPTDIVAFATRMQGPAAISHIQAITDIRFRWFGRFFLLLGRMCRWGLYPFSVSYRWSVKATCLIYLPLVWLANKAQYTPRTSVRLMLHDYLVDDIQRVRRWLAVISVSALTVKLFVWWHLDEARAWAHEHMPGWGLRVLRDWHHFIDPQHIPLWQITPALNGVLALGLMVYARRVLNLKDHIPADALVLRNWRIVNVLSGALSIYTIGCLLLITWKAGDLLGSLHKLWEMLDRRVIP